MIMSKQKASGKKKKVTLSEAELQKRNHIKDIRTTMENIVSIESQGLMEKTSYTNHASLNLMTSSSTTTFLL